MAWNPIYHQGYGGGDARRSAAIEDITNMVRQNRLDEEARQRFLADQLLKKQHADAYTKQVDAQEERTRATDERQRRVEEFGARQKINDLIGQGRIGEAQSLAGIYGFGLNPAQAPAPPVSGGSAMPDQVESPQMPMMPAMPEMGGSMPGPRDTGALHGGMDARDVYQPPETPMQAAMAQAGGNGVQAMQSLAKGPGAYTLSRGEESYTIDPTEGKAFAQRQLDEKVGGLRGQFANSKSPLIQKYGEEALVGVQGGLIAPEKALDWMLRRQAEDNDLQAAQMRQRKGGGQRLPKPPSEGANRDDARADLQSYLSNTDFKGTLKADAEFKKMLTMAQANNPFTDRALIGAWTKMAQGGAGVLSDSDIEQFWNRAGSPTERTENYLSQALSGKFGEERRRQVRDAIAAMAATAQQNLDQRYVGASEIMRPYGETGARWLRAYFGKGLPDVAGGQGKGKAGGDINGILDTIMGAPKR